MDTHLIGSNLIYIDTGTLVLKISGKASHPSTDIESSEKCSKLNIKKIPVDSKVFVLGEEVKETYLPCEPLFYEQRDYEIYIEYNDGDDVRFVHENENIRRKVVKKGVRFPVLSGVINFSNEIGYSALKIEVNGKEALCLEIEVFPSKLDYQNDYKAMLQDITAEVYNLAFSMLQKTYQNLDLKNIDRDKQSPVEYLALFEHIYEKLQNAMTVIESYPNHKLERYTEVVPAHKVKNCDNGTIKWMCKHGNKAYKDNLDRVRFTNVQVTKKHVNVDTFENRLVKHILTSTQRTLKTIKSLYLKNAVSSMRTKDISVALTDKIDNWCNYLNKKTNFSFLKQVSDLDRTESMSLVFAMAPGYRELYKCYLMLQKGLSLFGDLYKLSLKDVAVLYEYWCYIKLNSLVKSKGYVTKKNSPISIDRGGMFVTMKKGVESIVEYKHPENGNKIILAYNREYTRSKDGPILTQKPDNVFSLIKETDNAKYEYIFDAKYKINQAIKGSDYEKKFGTPGPQEQDINTMHRYRDAIVHRNKDSNQFERNMYGAYVLFPYGNEEEYSEHQFYKSIENVNVGAVPFLPDHVNMVNDFLTKLIDDSDDGFSRKIILPPGKKLASKYDFTVGDKLIEVMEKQL